MLRDQMDAVLEDIGADAVKIGMLHAPEIVHTVAEAIDRHALSNVVFDPVMVATSGSVLIDKAAVDVLVRELFPRVTVITPNLDEAALLVGRALTSAHDMEQAALTLLAQGARAVVLKGGHLPGDTVIDLLVTQTGEKVWMQAPRIHSPNTHGTGCTLSSAMAAYLALGASLVEAVQQARIYVREALQAGSQVRTGQGSGPLNHSYAPLAMRLKALA
jgi:hydroxymethylpyrimidine/phosphomethylpyrimidine kinase